MIVLLIALLAAPQQRELVSAGAAEWLARAGAYARENDSKAALAAARKAEDLAPNDPHILQGLVNFYAKVVPDPARAASLGARYAEASPQDVTAWSRLTVFCLGNGQVDAAISAATRALKINPYDESTHFQLSQAYLLKQDFPSAIGVLRNARKIFDKSPQIELALGVAYYGARKFPEAAEQFFTTMRLAPDVPQPYFFLGRMLDHVTERLSELVERCAQFETRNPDNYLGYLVHGKALIAQSAGPAAVLPLLQKAAALKDDDSDTHLQLGVVLEQKRDFASAAAQLERSVQLNPKDPAVHFRLARVYDRLGRKDDAAKERDIHEKLSEQEKGR